MQSISPYYFEILLHQHLAQLDEMLQPEAFQSSRHHQHS